MYKIAGNVNYPYGSISPSDPCKLALGFYTMEEAEEHTDRMNKIRLQYPEGSWNLQYWKEQPEPWVTFKVKDPE